MSLTNRSVSPIEIFYSYSHKDEKLRNRLEKHLSLLKHQRLIINWHDRMIDAGNEWQIEIDTHLNSAQIILLLVSPDFLASNYCYSNEMKRALERHDKGEACVIPVILRPCDWYDAPFGKLQALPTDGKPVTNRKWGNIDEAFVDVAKGIRNVVLTLSKVGDDTLSNGEEKSQQLEEDHSPSTKIEALSPDIYSQKVDDAIKQRNLDLTKDKKSQTGKNVIDKNLHKRNLLFALVILPFLLLPILLLSDQQQQKLPFPENDQEAQDQNLDVQFIGIQQETFALPGDPLKLSPNQLSKQGVPALSLDQPKQPIPNAYRIAIRIRNLRRDQYVLLIDQVQFIVEQISHFPHPLYALIQNPHTLSNYNLYRGTYTGQDMNVPINTKYDYPPYTYVYLALQETDIINIQVTSSVEALLSFRIAIRYRVANEDKPSTLMLHKLFQVVFSDKSNLHLYQQLRDGHFTHLDTP